ncbi:ABC transporter substrate-binding protein [Deinococcus aerius]|uniref:ABC transporter substrate-binding protein n=1 Tax=Deinococcus aerius TaxID=200253 RepID=UPI000CCC7115|nr:ABC transporter substrate-binding protein [Deinococcus aerius]
MRSLSSLLRAALLLGLGQAALASPITLKHELGKATFTAAPGRVIANSEEVAELLTVLGVPTVGYASGRVEGQLGQPMRNLSTLAAPTLKRAVYIGRYDQPSLELVAALKPDLILMHGGDGSEKLYPTMRKFAPTVVYDYDKTPWRKALGDLGRLFGKSAQANAYLNTFDARVRALRAQMAPVAARAPRTTLLYMYEPGSVMVLGRGFSFSRTLAQLGLTLTTPKGIDPNVAFQTLSPETLLTLDTDRVVVLRVKKGGQLVERNATDDVLRRLGKPVFTYPLDPQEASSGPLTDLKRLEGVAKLVRR